MRETTYAYLVGAYSRILDDLKEAKALAPYRDDKNKEQIEDLKASAKELRSLFPFQCNRKSDRLVDD